MPLHIEYSMIAGKGVQLEPLSLSHAGGLYAIGQEADDWRYLPRPCFASLEDTEGWVEEACLLSEKHQHYSYAIVDSVNGEIMGSTRYLNIVPQDYVLEIGYTFLGKAYQRSRVNTLTKYLMLENAFGGHCANRVELRTDQRNIRSQRAIERIGAIKEGVLRKHRIVQQAYVRDTVVYSILADEWPLIQADLSKKIP